MKKSVLFLIVGIFCLFFSSGILASSTENEQKSPFIDVDIEQWYYPYVQYLYDEEVVHGISRDYFMPEQEITRAEFVKIVANTVNKSISDYNTTNIPFNDVLEDSWYINYVKWAYSENIVKGKSSTSFEPEAFITREEAAVILYNVSQKYTGLALIKEKVDFKDEQEISDWAIKAVSELQKGSIIVGDNQYFLPKNNILRSEASKMVASLMQLNIKSSPSTTERIMESDVLEPSNALGVSNVSASEYDFIEKNFILASERNRKNTDFYLNDIENQISACLAENADSIMEDAAEIDISKENSDVVVLSEEGNKQGNTVEILSEHGIIGTWCAFYSGNYWNSGGSASIIAYTNQAGGRTRARSECYCFGIGSASSWALTGSSVYMTGSGSRNADITFKGSYAGMMNPGFCGASAGVIGNLVVEDLSTGSVKCKRAVINKSSSVDACVRCYVPFTQTLSTRLYAGHTYLFYFSIGTSVSNYSPQGCNNDFYNTTASRDWGVRTNYISINY